VRALLALALDGRRRPQASGDLRPLRVESLRRGRAAALRMNVFRRVAPWLAIALLIALADQASKNAVSASLRLGEVRESRRSSTLCWRTTGARRSASSPTPAAGRGCCSSHRGPRDRVHRGDAGAALGRRACSRRAWR